MIFLCAYVDVVKDVVCMIVVVNRDVKVSKDELATQEALDTQGVSMGMVVHKRCRHE
jgi:hypothetical protein